MAAEAVVCATIALGRDVRFTTPSIFTGAGVCPLLRVTITWTTVFPLNEFKSGATVPANAAAPAKKRPKAAFDNNRNWVDITITCLYLKQTVGHHTKQFIRLVLVLFPAPPS